MKEVDMCLGANFIHEPKSKSERANVELKLEGILDGRLWSWLVLCDDCMYYAAAWL